VIIRKPEAGRRIRRSPGERYAYNDSGYSLLGVIIQKASRLKYGEYLAKNVFVPAGIRLREERDAMRFTHTWLLVTARG
jgi:CubicO group peptidase (beta-lactamase class C family)